MRDRRTVTEAAALGALLLILGALLLRPEAPPELVPEPPAQPPLETEEARAERLELEAERAKFAERAILEHLEQRRDGTAEGVRNGRLCWYCKKPHAWSACPSR